MAAIVRSIYPKVKKQLLAKERFIQVLVGPRQVGKTTMVRQMVQEWPDPSMMVSADALPNAAAEWLITQWEAARLQAREATAEKPMLLVVDEIQKIDNWSEVVKKLWDEDAQTGIPLKAILLGSSRMLIQQGLTESLAGRFERTYLGHWTYAEMRDAFDFSLDQYIWFGGYPGSAQLIGDEERWRRYVNDALLETSISKDVLMLTQVSKPALMRRLFELGSYYSGKELSFTKLLGQLTDAGNTVTLSRYLELLDTAGLLSGLEKYSVNLVRQRSSSPKFQVHNNAMLTVMSNPDFNQWKADPKLRGRWIESAVGAYLLNCSLEQGFQVYYWRDRNDEVDFVLERRGKIVALEVKSGIDKPTPGLGKFSKQFPEARLLACGGTGIPLEEFLQMNVLDLF